MSEWSDFSAFQRDCLRVIADADADPSGLEIKTTLESEYGAEVNHGRLYPNLDTLVEDGLVGKSSVDGRTNAYALTEDGLRELRIGARQLEQAANQEDPQLATDLGGERVDV